ncbi:hypothetical protein [Nitratifractor sp.]|nr:hypothetical protein [Nitratifractor sp.]
MRSGSEGQLLVLRRFGTVAVGAKQSREGAPVSRVKRSFVAIE